MTREDQIKQAAAKAEENLKHIDPDVTTDYALGFEAGARWADTNNPELEQLREENQAQASTMRKMVEHQSSPWISVEERLPEEDERVLFAMQDGENLQVAFGKQIGGRIEIWNSDIRPTHWMPISLIK